MAASKQFSVAGKRIFASPLAKKIANEKGIDLAKLVGLGSGPGGRIRAQDVLSGADGVLQGGPRTLEFVSVSRNQQLIKSIVKSKQTIPHYYLTAEIDVDELLGLKAEMNKLLAKDKHKVQLQTSHFILKASALACLKVPEANSSWQDTFIRQYSSVNISLPIRTVAGLQISTIYGVEKKGIKDISKKVVETVAKLRSEQQPSGDPSAGTFTVSDLTMYGVKRHIAAVYSPQACSLGVGSVYKRTVPDGKGGHRVANFLTVTLSCDHRVVDGAVGAQWLLWFRQFIEKPFTMIL